MAQSLDPLVIWFYANVTKEVVGNHGPHGGKSVVAGFDWFIIGVVDDYESQVKGQEGWLVVHACKELYHRRELGYRSNGAPKKHPEYLMARRENRLILDLVDAPNPT